MGKIIVIAYKNGSFKIEPSLYNIPEECKKWENIFFELTKNDCLEKLTIKQLKQLAKAVSLYGYLDSKDLNFTFCFQSSKLQNSFDALMQ